VEETPRAGEVFIGVEDCCGEREPAAGVGVYIDELGIGDEGDTVRSGVGRPLLPGFPGAGGKG